MQRWTGFTLLVIVVAASAAAFYFYSENRALHSRIAAMETPVVAAGDFSSPSGTLPVSSDPAVATTGPSAPIEVPRPPASEGERERFSDRRARGIEFMSRMLNDPEAREAALGRMKSNVDRRFGDFFVRLGLDEVQVEALRTLLAEKQLAEMEAGVLARSAETAEARAEARAWRDAKLATLDSGVAAILGEDGNRLLLEYAESASQRSAVEDIGRRASYGGAPLSQAASDQLVQVMRNVQSEYPVATNPRRGDGLDGDRPAITREQVASVLAQQAAQNQAVLSQSRSFLTQAQLEAVADKQIEDYERLERQLGFQLRNPDIPGRGMMGGGPGGFPGRGGPPPGR